MSTVTFEIRFSEDGVAFDPTSVVLSDPTGTYGIKADSGGTAVVADGTATTKTATGIYTASYASATSGASYTAYFEYVLDGESYWVSKTETAATSASSSPVGWSVDTLADQLRSEMDLSPDAPGGAIPDRISKIIREKGRWLFHHEDWLFRKTPGTLTVAAGDTEIVMPDDFKELDSRTMRVSDSGRYRLIWTQDPSAWQAAKDLIGHTATGTPRVALLYYTAGAWKAKIWPEAAAAYTYAYWYLKASPWSGDNPIADATVLAPTYWPEDFDDGWYALCCYHVYGRYRSDNAWQSFKSEFKEWLAAHKTENNETISDGLDQIEDAMGDFQATGAASMSWLPGGSMKWYGST